MHVTCHMMYPTTTCTRQYIHQHIQFPSHHSTCKTPSNPHTILACVHAFSRTSPPSHRHATPHPSSARPETFFFRHLASDLG
ncbi:hypothetical protein BDU57DRAFT_508384 [Ampelomyces quisqualis]|uniref:Uncharacterized protein n=1 Tax=Ampelomyces quisqualis TaxID=50730 RepID=A0A6A5QXN3_AMPQU|nr:hypothetical protein BDU57DRAFT_508384 [Ampelomyces quisqualis]